MENTTQPILCCIGQKVAGKPTQFLMERAIAAENLDWRVITVEVDAANFQSAVAGMCVMRFQAVRFFPSLQAPAQQLLAAEDAHFQFVGGVTSAGLAGESWNYWHHHGLAIREWVERQADLSQSICWLHGDSLNCRSLLVALQTPPQPKAIVWSHVPPQISQAIPPDLCQCGQEEEGVGMTCFEAGQAEELQQWWTTAPQANSIVCVGDAFDATTARQLVGERELQWLLATPDTASRPLPQLGVSNYQILNEVEQLLAREAYDYRRWTGRPADNALLRDAYDEYCDF